MHLQWSRNKINIGGANSQNVLSVRHGEGCGSYWHSKACLVYNFPCILCQSTGPKLGGPGPPLSKVGGVMAPLPPPPHPTPLYEVSSYGYKITHNLLNDGNSSTRTTGYSLKDMAVTFSFHYNYKNEDSQGFSLSEAYNDY